MAASGKMDPLPERGGRHPRGSVAAPRTRRAAPGKGTAMAEPITYRRVYEEAAPEDGARVLVDRVWPRGMRKDDAHLDTWLRDVAPSTELRRWYGHEPARFTEFRRRYRAELRDPAHESALRQLRDLAGRGRLTLLTATKDVDRSQAAVLAEWLCGAERSGSG